MATTNMTMRIDTALKKQAEELFADFGISMSTAYTMFLRQAVREQRIPFEISRNVPNEETLAAIREVQSMRSVALDSKSYSDVDAMMKELLG